ncbi:uncharacterized protein [Eucyclogobius newberryi]|uniref:uncharacterized protein n=1 Tax=Eucyclogobius newberryi TaxID=166745 RepID=UPI003B58C707
MDGQNLNCIYQDQNSLGDVSLLGNQTEPETAQNRLKRVYQTDTLFVHADCAQLDEVSSLHQDQVEKNKKLQSQNPQKDVEIQQLNGIIGNLTSKDEEHLQTISALKNCLEEERNCVQEQGKMIQKLTAEVIRLQSDIEQTKEHSEIKMSLLSGENTTLELQNYQQNSEIQHLKKIIIDFKSRVDEQLQAISDLEKDLEQEKTHLQAELNETKRTTRNAINGLKSQIQETTEENQELRARICDLEMKLQSLLESNKQLDREMTKHKISVSLNEEEFLAQIEALTEERAKLLLNISTREAEQLSIFERLEEITSLYCNECLRNIDIEMQKDEKDANIKQLKERLSSLQCNQEEHSPTISQLEKHSVQDKPCLRDEILDTVWSLEKEHSLQEQNCKLSATVDHLEKEAKTTKETIHELNCQIQEESEKNQKLTADVGRLEACLHSSEERKKELKREKNEHEEKFDQDRHVYLAQLDNLTQKNATLQSLLHKTEKERVILLAKLGLMCTFHCDTVKRNHTLQLENEQQKANIDKLVASLANLQPTANSQANSTDTISEWTKRFLIAVAMTMAVDPQLTTSVRGWKGAAEAPDPR